MNHYSSDEYILVAIDYAIKWVEATTLCINITVVITKSLYDHIFTQFDYPLIIAIDQGAHLLTMPIII
jgi:hypothetical protein